VITENPIYFILISMVTMCLGWGIRGLIIGGEKGSLVPGAFMGILCVWYTGSDLLMENVYLFAAACALGYSYGGMEPYGETMDLIMKHDSPRYNPSMGYLALAFKGSIWGGLGAAFLGMSFSAMSGVVYKWYDFVIFFAQVPHTVISPIVTRQSSQTGSPHSRQTPNCSVASLYAACRACT